MRILHLISSGGYFGAENMLVNLAKGLHELGLRCVIGVFENSSDPHTEVAERARKNSLPVILIPCKGRLDGTAVRTLLSHIRNNQIDIVHTHGYKASFYAWLAGRNLRIPLVATCHNWTRATIPLRLYAFVDLLVLKRFRRVVAVSLEIAKALQIAGISPERILVIPNGVDVLNTYVPHDDKPEHNQITVGAVGRLVEAKGFQYLLEAGALLLPKFPFVNFYIVGSGPFRPELERLSQNLGIQSHVTFAGEQEDMASAYSAMDIFVLPSLNEGMPMTVLEAMAAGKPVVASAVGGIPRIVTSGDTGLLVKPGSVDSLRDALTRLIEDTALRIALANRARAHVSQTYSLAHMAKKYADLYETLY